MPLAEDWGGAGRTRKRPRNRRSRATLLVNTRPHRRLKPEHFTHLAVVLVTIAIVLLVGWLSVRATGQRLFSNNEIYAIKHLDIDSDDRVALDYIRRAQGIQLGGNLFAFDIQDVRRGFLKAAPHYRAMEITRILPDTLNISLVPRQPIARIVQRGGYVYAVDAEARVFNDRDRELMLPVIRGYEAVALKPGDRVKSLAADAVNVLVALSETDLHHEVSVRGIHVGSRVPGREDAVRLYLKNELIVDLWWRRTQVDDTDDDLRARLTYLQAMIKRERSRGKDLKMINLTADDYTRNAAEYWN